MSIALNDNLRILVAKPNDERFGPYNNSSIALTSISEAYRYKGLTVGVIESGSIVEYWFKDGVADEDLELKTQSLSSSDSRTVISISSVLQSNKYYLVDSSAGSLTVALPASAFQGDFIWLQDAKGTWAANNVTVNNNGNNIATFNDFLSLDVNEAAILLTYVGGSIGWDVKELAGDFSGEGATGSGGGTPDNRTVLSANDNVYSNRYYLLDSSNASFAVTLPANPIPGDFIWLEDGKGVWASNNVTVNNGGNNIIGLDEALLLNVDEALVLLTYVGGTTGWSLKQLAGDLTEGSGALGATGATGATGPNGLTGPSGLTGNAGRSAYDIAVEQGFSGSEYNWLHTLATPMKENVSVHSSTVSAPLSSPFNIDVKTYQSYLFLAGFDADFAVNIRADSINSLNSLLSIGQSITCAFNVVNGVTPYKLAHVLIDGTEVPVSYWYSGEDAYANWTGAFAIYIVKIESDQYFVTVNQAPLAKVTA
jgi:hypothetical protein